MNAPSRSRLVSPGITLVLIMLSVMALASIGVAAESARGKLYQAIGSGPASVAATTSSPAYQALVVGGGGDAVGIAASQNSSIVGGNDPSPTSTERIFRGTFEPQ